jgi:hypothetical protein
MLEGTKRFSDPSTNLGASSEITERIIGCAMKFSNTPERLQAATDALATDEHR